MFGYRAWEMTFKVIKNGSSKAMLELTGSTGVWNDATLSAFFGKQDRGWPEKFAWAVRSHRSMVSRAA